MSSANLNAPLGPRRARRGFVGLPLSRPRSAGAACIARDQTIRPLTEWPQFRDLDWGTIAHDAPLAVVLDTRNSLDPATVRAAGLIYLGNVVPQGF